MSALNRFTAACHFSNVKTVYFLIFLNLMAITRKLGERTFNKSRNVALYMLIIRTSYVLWVLWSIINEFTVSAGF